MNAGQRHTLAVVVQVALDELRDLIDADPAAGYANRVLHDATACIRDDWLPALADYGDGGSSPAA